MLVKATAKVLFCTLAYLADHKQVYLGGAGRSVPTNSVGAISILKLRPARADLDVSCSRLHVINLSHYYRCFMYCS